MPSISSIRPVSTSYNRDANIVVAEMRVLEYTCRQERSWHKVYEY